MSVLGLAFSAFSCARASPDPLAVMFTLTPVVLAYTVDIKLHHSACTEQITLTCPCADAANAAHTSAKLVKTFFMKTPMLNMKRVYGGTASITTGKTRRCA